MYNFSPKARRFIQRPPEKDKFITILSGSIRSTKTWTLSSKQLFKLNRYKVKGLRLLIGQTKQTVLDNVLRDIFDWIGPKAYRYNSQSGELYLGGQLWLVMGAKDEGSEKQLRGKTVGIAVVDEATLVPESFWKQLIGRCSPEGARIYATTNPDTPLHFLKKNYIDNPELAGDVENITFTIDDNYSLSAKKKAEMRRLHTGVYYRRNILGEWVIASGAIYKDAWSDALLFDDADMPKGLLNDRVHFARYVAIDFGTIHQFVALDLVDDGHTIWCVREYVWDSAVENRQKTNGQLADDLEAFLKDAPTAKVVVDPAAASFKADLTHRGIWYSNANNDVLEGIQAVATLMATGRLRISRTCTNLIGQIHTYSWDEKAAKHGEEKPLKVNDDAVDSLRYGLYSNIPEYRLATAA
jgi:PBSX family phage terminase large subunit